VTDKVISYIKKLAWAFFNGLPPQPLIYQRRPKGATTASSTLVIMIDYDKFSARTLKTIGRTTYRCGREGLKYVLDYCQSIGLDYVDVITTDGMAAPNVYTDQVNRTVILRNGGSDIAALESLSELITRYTSLIVVNSSVNVEDARNINIIHREIDKCEAAHFVIGCNGNSHISPRLPLSPARTPHVITNFFAAPAHDVLATLGHARKLGLYSRVQGFANKFFAIRYFEIMLSRNAVFNGGVLVLLKNGKVAYYRHRSDNWPQADSRLIAR
jgi:hypothetical protein